MDIIIMIMMVIIVIIIIIIVPVMPVHEGGPPPGTLGFWRAVLSGVIRCFYEKKN